jgi:hypothetical protein
MRNKIDQMNFLQSEQTISGPSRLQGARSNEKNPPQPAGHNLQNKYVNIS